MVKYLSTLVFALAALQTASASPMVETRDVEPPAGCLPSEYGATTSNVYDIFYQLYNELKDETKKQCTTGESYPKGDAIVAVHSANGQQETVDMYV